MEVMVVISPFGMCVEHQWVDEKHWTLTDKEVENLPKSPEKDDSRPWIKEAMRLLEIIEEQSWLKKECMGKDEDYDDAKNALFDFIQETVSESLRMAAEKTKKLHCMDTGILAACAFSSEATQYVRGFEDGIKEAAESIIKEGR